MLDVFYINIADQQDSRRIVKTMPFKLTLASVCIEDVSVFILLISAHGSPVIFAPN